MTEVRCKKCNRLLMKGIVVEVQIKCPKCGYMNFIIHKKVDFKEIDVAHDMLNA